MYDGLKPTLPTMQAMEELRLVIDLLECPREKKPTP